MLDVVTLNLAARPSDKLVVRLSHEENSAGPCTPSTFAVDGPLETFQLGIHRCHYAFDKGRY